MEMSPIGSLSIGERTKFRIQRKKLKLLGKEASSPIVIKDDIVKGVEEGVKMIGNFVNLDDPRYCFNMVEKIDDKKDVVPIGPRFSMKEVKLLKRGWHAKGNGVRWNNSLRELKKKVDAL